MYALDYKWIIFGGGQCVVFLYGGLVSLVVDRSVRLGSLKFKVKEILLFLLFTVGVLVSVAWWVIRAGS